MICVLLVCQSQWLLSILRKEYDMSEKKVKQFRRAARVTSQMKFSGKGEKSIYKLFKKHI